LRSSIAKNAIMVPDYGIAWLLEIVIDS